MTRNLSIVISLSLLVGCGVKDNEMKTLSALNPDNFKTVIDGDTTELVILRRNNMEVCLSNYGARIVSLSVPDKKGDIVNVVLGFDSIQAYYPDVDLPKLGGTIGRYSGRIGGARFILDGDTLSLTKNNLGHCLHGGAEEGDLGWQYKMFRIMEVNDSSTLMTMTSKDGENGFPGEMKVYVKYTLTSDNALRIDYNATTDKATVINMANQSYFNLSGNPDQSISDLRLYINASRYMPIDSTRLVTGEFADVEGTPLDFRKEKLIGRDIDNAWNEQIKFGSGYDHTFILDTQGNLKIPAVSLHCRRNGVIMDIYTTEPSVQFYTGNFLHSSLSRRQNENFSQRHGLSLETQHFPDSPNHPEWPCVVLRPGEEYKSTTIYSFRLDK